MAAGPDGAIAAEDNSDNEFGLAPHSSWYYPGGRPQEPDERGPLRLALPVYASVEVLPESHNTECMMIASLNMRRHGQEGDGVTVYSSVTRTDFTFRTGVFAHFPANITRHERVTLRAGQWNEIAMALSEQRATYWINGHRIASCNFSDGELPPGALSFGLVSYATTYRARRFHVSQDSRILSVLLYKVITLHGSSRAGSPSVSCTNMGGDEVANLDVAAATKLMQGTQVYALDGLQGIAVTYNADRQCLEYRARQPRVRVQQGAAGRVCGQCGPEGGEVVVDFDGYGSSVWVKSEYMHRLRISDAVQERLGDFRGRLAATLGMMECDLKLVLPDGTLLGDPDDAQPLSACLGMHSQGCTHTA